MKSWLSGIHHVQVQKFRMLLLQATVWGEMTAPYIICTWGLNWGQKIPELGWQYCNPVSEHINMENTGTLDIPRNNLSINLHLITVTVFITRKALSLMCHVAQEIIDSALKHARLKKNNKFWRELCILHDDKQKANRVESRQIKSNPRPKDIFKDKPWHWNLTYEWIRADSIESNSLVTWTTRFLCTR